MENILCSFAALEESQDLKTQNINNVIINKLHEISDQDVKGTV